jgi:NAD(P)H dehydrogenase (quinone)
MLDRPAPMTMASQRSTASLPTVVSLARAPSQLRSSWQDLIAPAAKPRGTVPPEQLRRRQRCLSIMLIQVVHCHPLVESYNHALFRTIVETLKQDGHKVVATDLYREGFQPAMTEQERRTYMDMSYDKSAVADYAKTLKEVEGVILCFPHWWFSMPAVLKGWVDRVWGPGVAFTYNAKDNHLSPDLGNIRLFGVVTTYGSPWWVVRLFAGDAGRKVLMRGMKPMCAKGARSFYLAHYNMDHSTERSRQAFLDKVRRTVAGVG